MLTGQIKPSPSRLSARGAYKMWFERLGKRERIILITGAVFLAVFFLATGMILPLVNAHSALEKNIAQKEQQIIKAFDLAAKIHSVEKISEKAALRKDSGFSVFSFIEKLASNTGVKNRLEYIKPISGTGDHRGEDKRNWFA